MVSDKYMFRYCLIGFDMFNKGVIYMVYDLDENYDEINQKRQMPKLTKGSIIAYITPALGSASGRPLLKEDVPEPV